MNIPKDILDQLCDCIDVTCTKPHTIKELEAEKDETIVLPSDEVKPMCPVCKNNENTYEYDFQNQKEIYCNGCFNSFTDKGERIAYDDTEEIIDVPPTKHTMLYDSNCYSCDSCEFETIWIKEANQHELVNDGGPPVALTPSKPKEELHYTRWKAQGEWYCIYCPATFTDFNKSLAHENDAGKKANQTSYTTTSYAHCKHKPQEVLKSENEGWSIWAGRKWDCEDNLNDFDIVLNLSGTRVSKRHEIPIKSLKKWESKEKYTEICLDWPDRGIVSLPKQWWSDLLNHLKQHKLKMLVFCVGGHGRTGTAISSLLVTAFGYTPKEATEWVWGNYCDEAVETNSQIQYVYGLVGETYEPPVTETKPTTTGQTALISSWNHD
jgi:hypothetical protein